MEYKTLLSFVFGHKRLFDDAVYLIELECGRSTVSAYLIIGLLRKCFYLKEEK